MYKPHKTQKHQEKRKKSLDTNMRHSTNKYDNPYFYSLNAPYSERRLNQNKLQQVKENLPT